MRNWTTDRKIALVIAVLTGALAVLLFVFKLDNVLLFWYPRLAVYRMFAILVQVMFFGSAVTSLLAMAYIRVTRPQRNERSSYHRLGEG